MRITLLLSALLAIGISSCGERIKGNGNRTVETRNTGSFTGVKLEESFDVELSTGPLSVVVEADENLMEFVSTRVNGNELEITSDDNVRLRSKKPILIKISLPSYSNIAVSGSGRINAVNTLETANELTLRNSGSGQLNLKINAPEVNASLSGSGLISLQGDAKSVEAKVSGSGDFDAHQLKAETAAITVSGSGDATIFGSDKIEAKVSGSGSVRYKGGGTVRNTVSGSGSVTPY